MDFLPLLLRLCLNILPSISESDLSKPASSYFLWCQSAFLRMWAASDTPLKPRHCCLPRTCGHCRLVCFPWTPEAGQHQNLDGRQGRAGAQKWCFPNTCLSSEVSKWLNFLYQKCRYRYVEKTIMKKHYLMYFCYVLPILKLKCPFICGIILALSVHYFFKPVVEKASWCSYICLKFWNFTRS